MNLLRKIVPLFAFIGPLSITAQIELKKTSLIDKITHVNLLTYAIKNVSKRQSAEHIPIISFRINAFRRIAYTI
jgi:hypothetical protein